MSSTLAKYLKKINIKETIILVILAVLIFIVIRMMFGGVFGTSLVVIENGPCPNSSMCPTYNQGDMFLIHKSAPEKIVLGDVIVYESESFFNQGILIIHRVVNITIITDGNGVHYYYRVSGDNPTSNDHIDEFNSTTSLIPYEAVLGKTVFLIPKIGYLRLWLTDLPVFRYLLLGLLIIFAGYLILAPDKEKKDKEEIKEDSDKEIKDNKTDVEVKDLEKKKELKLVVKTFFINWWNNTKISFKELFTVKKKRNTLIIYTSIIIALLIAIPIVDVIIRYPNLTTGIDDIDVLIGDNRTSEENIIFLPLIVHFKHDGSWNTILKEFIIYGIQNDTILSMFRWCSYYQKEGNLLIGGSLVFNSNEFDIDSSLTIKISYTLDYRFGKPQTFDYTEIFDSLTII